MESVVAININPYAPTQIAPQDLTSNRGSQTTPGDQAGDATASAEPASEVLPAQSDQITAHAGLVALASGALQSGVGSLVAPDLDGEGARLQALQLQQQLSVQSVSIANQAPQALLALLR
jgi:flagellin